MVSGEGMTFNQYCSALDALALDMSEVEMSRVIHCLQTADMTPEEHTLHRMMQHKNLQHLLN